MIRFGTSGWRAVLGEECVLASGGVCTIIRDSGLPMPVVRIHAESANVEETDQLFDVARRYVPEG